ncbi:MAG TPA: site-specific integrase [Terracidiphilus sp.]|nr:site-specific integrase [Terracidiphilus sp.]
MKKLYKLISTPGLAHRYQVVYGDGLPEIALTLFAQDQETSLSSSSVPQYLREIISVANWASQDHIASAHGWTLFGSPQEVRALLREYLTKDAHCKVTIRADLCGLKVSHINATNGTRINVRTLLSALKRLYDFLIATGRYGFPNPMVHEGATTVRRELREQRRLTIRALRGRDPMPSESGVDERLGIRLSENYFRFIQQEWKPQTVDDPEFPAIVQEAGKRFGWKLRELCVCRTLFESGVRISEAVGLTAADWSHDGFRNTFLSRNKGSFGVRTKTIMVSDPTAKLYRRYFDDEVHGRAAADLSRLRVSDLANLYRRSPESLDSVPLFLTERGQPLTAKLFREHYWKPALAAAGIDADPHQARHWFVTNALRNIDRTSKDETSRARRRQELMRYMAWNSGERTLRAYDHSHREDDFRNRLRLIHREMTRRERQHLSKGVVPIASSIVPVELTAERSQEDLAFLLGEDNDD